MTPDQIRAASLGVRLDEPIPEPQPQPSPMAESFATCLQMNALRMERNYANGRAADMALRLAASDEALDNTWRYAVPCSLLIGVGIGVFVGWAVGL